MRSAPSDMSAQDVQLKSRMSKLFARGVRSKYESDGLPDQAAVLMDRGLGAGNSSEYCDPDKGCNSPISLDGIWGYFKASYFDTRSKTFGGGFWDFEKKSKKIEKSKKAKNRKKIEKSKKAKNRKKSKNG